MVEGRSKQTFKTWLAARPQAWRDQVEVAAMDGFSGFKTATVEELSGGGDGDGPVPRHPAGRRCPGPLPPHRPAGAARPPRPGLAADPLYRARRTLHTGLELLTDKQHARLTALFADDRHVQVEATWGIYQKMITAYRDPDRARGKTTMTTLTAALSMEFPPP